MEKLYTLDGFHQVEGDIQSLFTSGERATALAIAKVWLEHGWNPVLFSKTYDGKFQKLFDYRNHKRIKKSRRQAA
jgi:hypothetical protein